MATVKKKRTKRYTPRTASSGLHILAERVVAHSPLPVEHRQNIAIDYYTALDAMIGGYASGKHFDTLVYAVNVARILADNGIGGEYEGLVEPALLAMQRCKQRFAHGGKYGLDGDGIQAMRAMAPLHEAQIEASTARELEAAVAEMHRRIDAGIVVQ